MKLRSFKVSAGQAPVSKTGVAVVRFGRIDRGCSGCRDRGRFGVSYRFHRTRALFPDRSG